MDETQGTSVWAETGYRAPATVAPSTPRSLSSPAAALLSVEPSTDVQLVSELTPCLALVAPVGMDGEAQATWFEAAMKALAALPFDLLQRGAAAAMRTADHPSKIVPAIIAEVGDSWARRRELARAPEPATPTLPAPGGHQLTGDEATEICKRYGVGRFSSNRPAADPARPVMVGPVRDDQRPSKVPTRQDYLGLGVSAETLDRIEAERAEAAE